MLKQETLQLSRREFLRFAGAAGLMVVGTPSPGEAHDPVPSSERQTIDLVANHPKGNPEGRRTPEYLWDANYAQHVSRTGRTDMGGIDYAPAKWFGDTEICPAAAGYVVGVDDGQDERSGGMNLLIGHGLGWRTVYAHLQARYVRFPERVGRREVIGIMGRSGWGASRSGVMEVHLHMTLFGPIYSPIFRGIQVQDLKRKTPIRWRYVLDPEELSLSGQATKLPYSREADEDLDRAFITKHQAAVTFCDRLLDRIPDEEARQCKKREPWERGTGVDVHVDERIWFLWSRLRNGTHPFSPEEASEYKATLTEFMRAAPRFTAPIVEVERRGEYSLARSEPLEVFRP